ncbi:hypothetical protein [Rouxiella aceris]|nr:hypothetical protein [Rouxiella aceris]
MLAVIQRIYRHIPTLAAPFSGLADILDSPEYVTGLYYYLGKH